jgi:membrane associated rhomboid family serine protease
MFVSGERVFELGEHWRLVGALFMHADWVHLLSNVPLFLFFGWLLRAYFGYLAFPFLAFVIGAGANLITIYFYHATSRLMGASGMVYGMIALWLVLYVSHDEDDSLGKKLLRASAFASLMLLPRTYEQSTSYLAHGSGFMLGLICGFCCLPFLKVIEE